MLRFLWRAARSMKESSTVSIERIRAVIAPSSFTGGPATKILTGFTSKEEYVQSLSQSVVGVKVHTEGDEIVRDQGSGVIVDSGGFILTALQLVQNCAPVEKIVVSLRDGRTFRANLVDAFKDVETNSKSELGVAVLKIDSSDYFTAAKVRGCIRSGRTLANLEWPPSTQNTYFTSGCATKSTKPPPGSRYGTLDICIPAFPYRLFSRYPEPKGKSYGGPIVDFQGDVVGIRVKNPPEDETSIFALWPEPAMMLVDKHKIRKNTNSD